MTATKDIKKRTHISKSLEESLSAFPDYKAAKQAQIDRLANARAALLKDKSYEKIRDWFLTSTMFAKLKENVAQWCENELGDPDKLPAEIAEHVLKSGLLAGGVSDLMGVIRPHILNDDVVQYAGDTIATYAEQKVNDDKLLYTICAEIEKKAGSFGWLAHLVGVMDTRVLTHDIADAIADYAKSLRGPKKNEVRIMLSTIVDNVEDFNFENHLSKMAVKAIISRAIAHIGREISARIREEKLQTLPVWADALTHQMYNKVVTIVFQSLTASVNGSTAQSEEEELTSLIASIILNTT